MGKKNCGSKQNRRNYLPVWLPTKQGGLIVDVFGMETFLPGSQIDVKPVTDYDQFVGKTWSLKVVKN